MEFHSSIKFFLYTKLIKKNEISQVLLDLEIRNHLSHEIKEWKEN